MEQKRPRLIPCPYCGNEIEKGTDCDNDETYLRAQGWDAASMARAARIIEEMKGTRKEC